MLRSSVNFLKRDFHLPAQHQPFHDLLGREAQIGAEQGLRLKPARNVADSTQRSGTNLKPL